MRNIIIPVISLSLILLFFSCKDLMESGRFSGYSDNSYQTEQDSAGEISADNESLLQDVSKYRQGKPAKRVLSLPKSISQAAFNNPAKNLKTLVAALIKDEKDDFQKIKNIHDWIALHIFYDAAAYNSGNYPSQSYTTVLKTRRAVCEGYANLFLAMSKMAGFDCIKIYGYSRGYGFEVNRQESITENHAWNAVHIGKAWYIVDVTWDSGSYDGITKKSIPGYDTSYLFIPPRGSIFTHFPTNKKLQLINPPYSRKDFLNLPYLTGDYYDVFKEHPQGVKKYNTVEDSAVIVLPPYNDDYVVDASIMSEKENQTLKKTGNVHTFYAQNIFIDKTAKQTIVRIYFPEKGEWHVSLSAMKTKKRKTVQQIKHKDGTTAYKGMEMIQIADLFYKAQKGSDKKFPVIGFRQFVDYSLHEPLRNPLQVGEKVHFSFTVKNVKSVKIEAFNYDAEKQVLHFVKKTMLTGKDDNFETDMVIPEANRVYISIPPKDGGSSMSLVIYDVIK
ncbi:MAG: transglutaminase domain-containing protein [Spirochaetia bacterium]